MKKMIAIFCCGLMLTMPAMAGRETAGSINPNGGNTSNYEYCMNNPEQCSGGRKTHAKKNSNTTTIIVASVATAAVVAGLAWYFFKKTPSENNPGQIKLATF